MPNGRGSGSLKNRELYEELRNEGASKEKAARISNAVERDGQKAVSAAAAQSGDYDDWTVAAPAQRAPRSSGCRATRANASPSSSRCCAITETQHLTHKTRDDVARLVRVRPGEDPGYRRIRVRQRVPLRRRCGRIAAAGATGSASTSS